MSKIEDVAKAIDECPEWPAKTYRQRVAIAAIEAMRVPTRAMHDAAMDCGPDMEPDTYWRAMLNAALKDTP